MREVGARVGVSGQTVANWRDRDFVPTPYAKALVRRGIVARLWHEGLSVAEIARRVQVPPRTVRHDLGYRDYHDHDDVLAIAPRAPAPSRVANSAPPRRASAKERREARRALAWRLHRRRMGVDEIAEQLGVSADVVRGDLLAMVGRGSPRER